ncbi:MAG: hypothetical protein Ta2A_27310 [Treponemataceae bacterium]|nr:MAG: hypothetical protein Ta2A_27310 [Treponemataceae bacterium]
MANAKKATEGKKLGKSLSQPSGIIRVVDGERVFVQIPLSQVKIVPPKSGTGSVVPQK